MEVAKALDLKKSLRKQKRAHHRLLRDMNIKCSEVPTQYLAICNAGLVTGIQIENLQYVLSPLVSKYNLIMPTGKSYCFIAFSSKEDAVMVFNKIHGYIKLPGQNTPLYLVYTESVPCLDENSWSSPLPPGIKLIEDFITEEEEMTLLQTVEENEEGAVSSELKHRKVRHFGYEFQYENNTVDSEVPIVPIPPQYKFLQEKFQEHDCGQFKYDQLTINRYSPGQGIPPHIDTHSVFEDTILSLSLGSHCTMNFKRVNDKITVFLPRRSLLVMSGESRYAWTHGISPRHHDVIKTENGFTTLPRSTRTSFTFRKVRTGDCQCNFPTFCNSKRNEEPSINNKVAVDLERSYVHQVYEEISNHFDETRQKQWPNVANFLDTLQNGEILLDVGCGNGKYLQGNPDIFKIGCDRSVGLTEICRNRGFQVILSDCLYLPYRDSCIDAVISIAVIHHLSTAERRQRAISEIARVLRPQGKCLIYVWAKEQHRNSVESTYLRFNTNKTKKDVESTQKMTEQGVLLPIHENRTAFTHKDMLVPWKKKGGGNFLRYYHVFQEGELAKLCTKVQGISVKDVYYDQGNWCIILEKNIEQ